MSSPGHICVLCGQIYSTRSRLRRHEASHNSQCHINCEHCGHRFSRNDALRRHYKSCSQIGIQPEPAPGRPGRRRKACDSCARNRIACDGNSICRACQQNGNTCSYRRLGGPPSGLPEPPLNVPRIATTSHDKRCTTHQDSQNQSKVSVPFLLNYSAASSQSPGDVNQVLSLLSTAESKDQNLEPALPSFDVEADRADLFFEDSWGILFRPFTNDGQPRNSSVPGGLDDPDKRQAGTDRIIQCLLKVCSDNPDLCVGFDIDRARDFVQEENVHDFTKAYFEETVRPRSRIVLKSSFNLDLVSTPLLLSILLMGALCGTSERMKSQAADYVDMAELAVFKDPSFLQLLYKSSDFDPRTLSQADIQILQASILMTLVQISSPNTETRRRIRIQRYPALVAVARATSLTRINNWWHSSNASLDHRIFLHNETCIRMMASISMIDCHFIMFFNNPPHFTQAELDFDFPAEDQGIDISDEVAWQEWAVNERKYQRPPPLSRLLKELLSGHWTGPEELRFENLNIFTLFIVISAFHRIIYDIRSCILDTSDARRQIDRALLRWMRLWENLQPRLGQDEIYRAGFMTHAQDLWVFAKFLLRQPLSETGGIARDSMADIHRLLKGPLK